MQYLVLREADGLLHLRCHPLGLRHGKVDLVHDRDNRYVVLQGEVYVGEGLRLNALRGVDDQDCALARGERARDLVSKVHVAGRIDEVELVVTVAAVVVHAHGLSFDGDPSLTFQVHLVHELLGHVTRAHRFRELEEAVGERGLAVVNVSDDAEVSDS